MDCSSALNQCLRRRRHPRAGEFGRLAGARTASIDARPRLPPEPESDRHGRLLQLDLDADVGGEWRRNPQCPNWNAAP